MTKTEHYQLNQWDAADRVLREDFNSDNQKIDAALAQLQNTKGNCQLVTGSYTGTGTYGSSHKNTLTFSKAPLLLFIAGDRVMWTPQGSSIAQVAWSNSGETISVTWSETGLSWYADNVYVQMNNSGTTYRYIALVSCA